MKTKQRLVLIAASLTEIAAMLSKYSDMHNSDTNREIYCGDNVSTLLFASVNNCCSWKFLTIL